MSHETLTLAKDETEIFHLKKLAEAAWTQRETISLTINLKNKLPGQMTVNKLWEAFC